MPPVFTAQPNCGAEEGSAGNSVGWGEDFVCGPASAPYTDCIQPSPLEYPRIGTAMVIESKMIHRTMARVTASHPLLHSNRSVSNRKWQKRRLVKDIRALTCFRKAMA